MDEDLTDAQLDELRAVLHGLDRSLRGELHQTLEASAPPELDQTAVGRVSRIDAI